MAGWEWRGRIEKGAKTKEIIVENAGGGSKGEEERKGEGRGRAMGDGGENEFRRWLCAG